MDAPGSFPSAEEAAVLPLDQLALRLLRALRDGDRSGKQPAFRDVINPNVWPAVDQQQMDTFLSTLTEAWDWLVSHGLIGGSHPPGRPPGEGRTFVTRRGDALLDDPDGLARLSAEMRLDLNLHDRIADRVRTQFLLGEYELAAIAALREVEIRVRDLSGAPDSLVGFKLMTQAFKDGGHLFDPLLDPGESVALMALFQGAIGVFKNPPSHRQVEYGDPTEASEVVLLADLLLRLLDQVERRLQAESSPTS